MHCNNDVKISNLNFIFFLIIRNSNEPWQMEANWCVQTAETMLRESTTQPVVAGDVVDIVVDVDWWRKLKFVDHSSF